MAEDSHPSPHLAWAHLRFSVVGPLLSAPPPRGTLIATFDALAEKTWRHPVTGEPIQIPASRQAKFKAGKALKDAVNK